jgi:hypothetical protein
MEITEKIYLVCTYHGEVLDILKSNRPFNEIYDNTIGKNNGEILIELDVNEINVLNNLLKG